MNAGPDAWARHFPAWSSQLLDEGEVAVRGPSLFSGYLNGPEPDGWFRTGDMATREPDGQLRIVGRRSQDLIKTAGYKVGAGEVELALLDHPGVAEAAVTGEQDADLGQRIVAWVVPRDGGAAPDGLADHVAALLAPHKRPREVRVLDELPRNAMGKVVKSRLGCLEPLAHDVHRALHAADPHRARRLPFAAAGIGRRGGRGGHQLVARGRVEQPRRQVHGAAEVVALA